MNPVLAFLPLNAVFTCRPHCHVHVSPASTPRNAPPRNPPLCHQLRRDGRTGPCRGPSPTRCRSSSCSFTPLYCTAGVGRGSIQETHDFKRKKPLSSNLVTGKCSVWKPSLRSLLTPGRAALTAPLTCPRRKAERSCIHAGRSGGLAPKHRPGPWGHPGRRGSAPQGFGSRRSGTSPGSQQGSSGSHPMAMRGAGWGTT